LPIGLIVRAHRLRRAQGEESERGRNHGGGEPFQHNWRAPDRQVAAFKHDPPGLKNPFQAKFGLFYSERRWITGESYGRGPPSSSVFMTKSTEAAQPFRVSSPIRTRAVRG